MRIRDSVTITQELLNAFQGQVLAVAARKISIPQSIKSLPNELVLLADHLFVGGSIDADGAPGASGADGPNGTDGSPGSWSSGGMYVMGSHNGQAGESGQPGDNGGNGRTVKIYAQHIFGKLTVSARGGAGGNGGRGGSGGNGVRDYKWHGMGASGAPGRDGGVGGNGGEILIYFCSSDDELVIDCTGGRGGLAGRGGSPGWPTTSADVNVLTSSYVMFKTDSPIAASDGTPGEDATGQGIKKVETLSSDDWFARVRGERNRLAQDWASHRAKQAEWLFRTQSEDPERLQLALTEAEAAIKLHHGANVPKLTIPKVEIVDTGGAVLGGRKLKIIETVEVELRPYSDALDQAKRIKDLIYMDQTPFGLPNSLDPRASFAHYEQWFLTYREQLQAVLTTAVNLFVSNITIDSLLKVIRQLATESKVDELIAEADEARVAFKQQQTTAAIGQIETRNAELQEKIRRRRHLLERTQIFKDVFGVVMSAYQVCDSIGSLFGLVGAIVSVPGAMVKIAGVAARNGDLMEDFLEHKDGKWKLNEEARKAFDDIGAPIDAKKKLFDEIKVTQALLNATGDEELNKLLAEQLQLIAERAKLQTQEQELHLEMNVVHVRRTEAEKLSQQAIAHAEETARTSGDLQVLANHLISIVRLHSDLMHRYLFQAERALQRWLFDEGGSRSYFGFGWVQPDIEADLVESAKSAEKLVGIPEFNKSLLNYLDKLLESGSRFDWAELRSKYDDSLTNKDDPISYSTIEIDVPDADLVDLVSNGGVHLRVAGDMAGQEVQRGTHVEAVLAAVTPAGNLKLKVGSSSEWSATAEDGTAVTGTEAARSGLVLVLPDTDALGAQVVDELSRLNSYGPGPQNPFWGCSPYRQWKLEANGAKDDLANITAVKLVFVVSGHAA